MKSQTTCLLLFVCLAILPQAVVGQSSNRSEPLDKAVYLIECCHFKQLIELCDKKLLEDPEDALHVALRGWAHCERGEYDQANKDTANAIELSPEDPNVLTCRAFVLGAQGKINDSIEMANKAVELDGQNVFALTQKAHTLYFAGRFVDSETTIDKALAIDSSFRMAMYVKANLYENQMRSNRAIEIHQQILKLNPGYIKSIIMLGYNYLFKQDYESAIEWSNKAIEANPECFQGYTFRGYTKALRDREFSDEVHKDFERAEELAPNHFDVYQTKADAYFIADMIEEALESVEVAVKLNPDFLYPSLNRASFLAHLERFDEAIEACDMVEDKYPDHFRPSMARANIFLIEGKHGEALEELNRATRQFDKNAWVYSMKCQCYDMAGNDFYLGKALSEINQAIELGPDVGYFYFQRSQIYRSLNRDDEADQDDAKAKELGFDIDD